MDNDTEHQVVQGGISSVVDMTTVEDLKFDVLPKGDYSVSIDQLEYKLSKASNQPMWAVVLCVTDGEYENRKLFANISFSPKALPGTKLALKAIKPELLQGPFDAKAVAESGDLLGIHCRVRVDVDSYEGTPNNKIKRWLVGGASAPAEGNQFLTGT